MAGKIMAKKVCSLGVVASSTFVMMVPGHPTVSMICAGSLETAYVAKKEDIIPETENGRNVILERKNDGTVAYID
jgi:hypothetical protein